MVRAYFDSSVLVAAYVEERRSPEARQLVSAESQVPFTPLHQVEVRNSFRLLAGWKRMSSADSAAVLLQLEDDVAAGRLIRTPLDLYATFERAEVLSTRHTKRLLSRSLDILHVAAALELGCTRFVSFDARQIRLAGAAGLRATNISG